MRQPHIIEFLQTGAMALHDRHKTIANNMANMNTPGYRRQDVKFEEMLGDMLDSGRKVNLRDLDVEAFQPRTTPVGPDGNDVDMDVEIGQLIKNSGKFKLAMKFMSMSRDQMQLAMQTKE